MNTTQKGAFRHIVFKDGDTWYAVALEFNIVESSDDSQLAYLQLVQAVMGAVFSLKKVKGNRYAALNQKGDKEYEDLWKKLNSPIPIKSPYQIAMYGYSKV